jgi:hypothetical protein
MRNFYFSNEKAGNPKPNYEKPVSEDEAKKGNKQCSTSLAIEGMETKITRKCPHINTRLSKTTESSNIKCW